MKNTETLKISLEFVIKSEGIVCEESLKENLKALLNDEKVKSQVVVDGLSVVTVTVLD
jgi:hypothetical protein